MSMEKAVVLLESRMNLPKDKSIKTYREWRRKVLNDDVWDVKALKAVQFKIQSLEEFASFYQYRNEDFKKNEVLLVAQLWKEGELSGQSIAKVMDIEYPNVRRLLQMLIRYGFLEKRFKRSKKNERKDIKPIKKGRKKGNGPTN